MNQLSFPLLSLLLALPVAGAILVALLPRERAGLIKGVALATALAGLSSWTAIAEQVKEYMILMLLMETAMLGVFVALDLFLFYVFWEASLIPMALLIGRWGGERRVYAAVKFFLFTMAGSAL